MTYRTIDMHCLGCRKYLFSLQPDDYKGLSKKSYCNNQCKILDKLKNSAKAGIQRNESNKK